MIYVLSTSETLKLSKTTNSFLPFREGRIQNSHYSVSKHDLNILAK